MTWHWSLRGLVIAVGGFGFFMITGDIGDSLLLVTIVSLIEFKYND